MKQLLPSLKGGILLAFLFAFASTTLFAQPWNPGTASPATNIDRTGNVTIGPPAGIQSSSNTVVTIDGGDFDYAAGDALEARSESVDLRVIGTASATLARAATYNSSGALRGVSGFAVADELDNTQSYQYGEVGGGVFGATLNDPINAPNTGKYLIHGVRATIKGSISTYPTNGWVAAVVGQDEIQGSQTWAGYFEGRGYFQRQVGIGTTTPIADLDVRGNNIFLSPSTGSGFPDQFAAMGESGGACDIYGFRAQETSDLFINMGIRDGEQPVIAWGTSGDLNFECDANEDGCGEKVASFSCPGMFTMRLNGPAVFSGGTYSLADSRLMNDVSELDDAMARLRNLNAVQYSFDPAANPEYRLPMEGQIGFMAEEVKEIIPEAVRNNDEGIEAINYDVLVPYLVEGIKEMDAQHTADQAMIAELNDEVRNMRSELDELKAMISQMSASDVNKGTSAGTVDDQPRLGQNAPNPFGSETRISYYVPTTASRATIEVTSLQGQVVAMYPAETGEGTITIPANILSEGAYLYSLIVDGNKVATQRMMVSK